MSIRHFPSVGRLIPVLGCLLAGLVGGEILPPAAAAQTLSVQRFERAENLPNPLLTAMAQDGSGHLWLHVQVGAGAPGVATPNLPAELTATFTDGAGRAVLRQALRPVAGLTTLDLTFLPEGTYLLVLRDGAGRLYSTHRVVRSR